MVAVGGGFSKINGKDLHLRGEFVGDCNGGGVCGAVGRGEMAVNG